LVCGAVQPALRGQAIFRALIPISSVPHNIEADCVTIWLCPAGHVVHYPVSNGRNFNIVAAVDAAGEISDWNEPRNASDVLDRFRHAADGLVSVLMRPKFWTGWQAADLPELPRWSKDNLLLLGDAAHASLPYLAQGAAMALEDAAILPALLKTGETAEAFKRFEAIRQPRTARLKAQSRQMTSVYHAAGTLARVRNATLKFGGSGLLLQRLAWLYDWTSE
jgi:salicylate hydroxylase